MLPGKSFTIEKSKKQKFGSEKQGGLIINEHFYELEKYQGESKFYFPGKSLTFN